MKLPVYISAHCYGAFLRGCERVLCRYRGLHIPLAVRSIPPVELRGPSDRVNQYTRYMSGRCKGWSARTFSHSLCTSLSASCLQVIRLSIQPSRVGIVAGSEAGADDSCIGSGILTSSMLVSMVARC